MSSIDALQSFWNARYAAAGFAYGTDPNDFLKQNVARLTRGRPVLCLADGEGRNGVWLARQGFEVTSVDIADEGLRKAKALAREAGVSITTVQADLAARDPGVARRGAIEYRFSGVRTVNEGPLHHGDGHVNQLIRRKPE